ncbi:MAG: choice-of-anchor Q domain-containing protein [Planctomycetota bacterium]
MASAAHADTIYVDDDNCPGPGSGTEGDPYCSIQTAIDNAVDDDEIVVADGTYTGDGNREIDFLGRRITLRSANGPDACIIDCQQLGRAFHFHSNETVESVLEGFTIIDGYAGGEYPLSGGGAIQCQDASPTIAECIFRDCFARSDGGAIHNYVDGNPTVTNCEFDGNSVGDGDYFGFGGAMCNEGGSQPTITNCMFAGNSGDEGGAVWSANAGATVVNCMFSGNTSNYEGGGMYNHASATVTNCTFSGNSASNGGGMYNRFGSPTVTNCVLWGDSPNEISGGAAVSFCNVEGGWPGTGNINADPLCADPANGDLRLLPGSPCIDAGDNTAVPEGTDTDLDGNPRFVDDPGSPDCWQAPGQCGDPPVVDMGAYEFQGATCSWDINGNGDVGISDFLLILADWGACSGCPSDINGDGVVNVQDFLTLLSHWGPCP